MMDNNNVEQDGYRTGAKGKERDTAHKYYRLGRQVASIEKQREDLKREGEMMLIQKIMMNETINSLKDILADVKRQQQSLDLNQMDATMRPPGGGGMPPPDMMGGGTGGMPPEMMGMPGGMSPEMLGNAPMPPEMGSELPPPPQMMM